MCIDDKPRIVLCPCAFSTPFSPTLLYQAPPGQPGQHPTAATLAKQATVLILQPWVQHSPATDPSFEASYVPIKIDGCTFCALQGNIVQGCPVTCDTSRLARSLLRTNDLISPMDIPRKSYHRLRFARTPQSKSPFRPENRRLLDEVLSWPLEGKLFRSTPAHIPAANSTI